MKKIFIVLFTVALASGAFAQATARKTSAIVVGGGDGQANPGDTLRYTIVITNTSSTNLLNAQFSDTNFPNQTLVGGSIKTTPIARPDSYSAIGNTLLTVPAGSSVLNNDSDPDGDTFSVNSFSPTSVNGGTVTMAGDGSCTYISAAGFTGTDTFTYTISDSTGLLNTTTVTITVSNRVWYVNNAGANGDGRQNTPFNSLTGAATASAMNDFIYVFQGTANYTAGITLKNSQNLVGSGDALIVSGTTIYSAGTRPILIASSGSGVGLATDNVVHGINVGSGNGRAFSGASVGNLVISNATATATGDRAVSLSTGTVNVTLDTITSTGSADNGINLSAINGTFIVNGGSIATAASTDFLVSAGNGTVTYAGTINNTAGRSVDISGRTGGTVTLSGNITDTGTGLIVQNCTGGTTTFSGATKTLNTGANTAVNLVNNTGTTINFTGGGLGITTTSGTGFNATGGGTISVQGTANIISSGNGTALNVVSTTIGASGLTFQSISSSGGSATGIILDNTGASGGLTVTGTGSAASGGTISSKTGSDGATTSGNGIYLNNCVNISLAYMNIQGNQNHGIRGNNVTGFTLDNSTVGTTAVNGTSNTADVDPTGFGGENSLRFYNLLGSARISNCTLDQGFSKTIGVANDSGTLDRLTITNCTVRQSLTNSTASDSLFVASTGSAVVNFTIKGACQFSATKQFHIDTSAVGASTMDIQITGGNAFSNTIDPVGAGGGLNLQGGGTDSFVTFNIDGNSFRQGSAGHAPLLTVGRCMTAGMVSGAGKFDGKFVNNTVGVTNVAFSGGGNGADGIGIFASGNKAATTRGSGTTDSRFLIQSNTFRRYGQTGIQISAAQGNSTLDATVLGNTMTEPGSAAGGAFAAVWVNAGALPADTSIVNVAVGGTAAADKNTMTNSDPNNVDDVFLDCNSPSHPNALRLYRNGSTATGSGEALLRQILVDDNNGPLDLLNGFSNGSTITVVSGAPPLPTN